MRRHCFHIKHNRVAPFLYSKRIESGLFRTKAKKPEQAIGSDLVESKISGPGKEVTGFIKKGEI